MSEAVVEFKRVREDLEIMRGYCVHVIHKGKEVPGIELYREGIEKGDFEQFKAWLKFYGFKIVPRGVARIVVLSPDLYDCKKQPPFEWPSVKGKKNK